MADTSLRRIGDNSDPYVTPRDVSFSPVRTLGMPPDPAPAPSTGDSEFEEDLRRLSRKRDAEEAERKAKENFK